MKKPFLESDSSSQNCQNCCYWFSDNDHSGECRIIAPRQVDSSGKRLWPITMPDDLCGDWANYDHKPYDDTLSVELSSMNEHLENIWKNLDRIVGLLEDKN